MLHEGSNNLNHENSSTIDQFPRLCITSSYLTYLFQVILRISLLPTNLLNVIKFLYVNKILYYSTDLE